MSADNWAVCPRCLKQKTTEAQSAAEAAASELEKSYGKVDLAEYQNLQAISATKAAELAAVRERYARDGNDVRTLREDYEIGVNLPGELFISYAGRCQTCGLQVNFQYTEAVE